MSIVPRSTTVNTSHSLAPSPSLSPATSSFLSSWTSAVRRRLTRLRLSLNLETPHSITQLYRSQPPFSTDTHISLQLEHLIRDAYVDDLYDGRMHCATIRDSSEQAVGIVYWRDVDEDDVQQWIKPQHAQHIITAATDDQHALPTAETVRPALLAADDALETDSDGVMAALSAFSPYRQLTAAHWLKVELLVTVPSHAHLHLATLLLSSALLLSASSYAPLPTHSMLHIAGGSHNTAATALYSRLGFRAIPREWVNEPNRDVWVMLDVMRWMRGSDWARVLGDGWDEVEERGGEEQGGRLGSGKVNGLLTDRVTSDGEEEQEKEGEADSDVSNGSRAAGRSDDRCLHSTYR